MLGVAYMGMVQGIYRAAMTLVACVLAGAIAFGVFGPLTAAIFPRPPSSIGVATTWYFAGDAIVLWAVFCVAFLLLRTIGEKLFTNEPHFPALANRVGGFVLGLPTGYLSVGVCMILLQMLPTAPDLLGYQAFRYVPASKSGPERIEAGEPLWLEWDRRTLAFFDYLSAHPLGSKESALHERYGDPDDHGDVYPPKEKRGEGYEPTVDADDVLYFHWYRRWEFIQWQMKTNPGGPLPQMGDAVAVPLVAGRTGGLPDLQLQVSEKPARMDLLPDFEGVQPPAGQDFVVVKVLFKPVGRGQRRIETSQFFLKDTQGVRYKFPLIYGLAVASAKTGIIVPNPGAVPPEVRAQSLRYGFAPEQAGGHYLMDSASFDFKEAKQVEVRSLVFLVPKTVAMDKLQLFIAAIPLTGVPVRPTEVKPAAKPPEIKPPAVKATTPGTAGTGPAAPASPAAPGTGPAAPAAKPAVAPTTAPSATAPTTATAAPAPAPAK